MSGGLRYIDTLDGCARSDRRCCSPRPWGDPGRRPSRRFTAVTPPDPPGPRVMLRVRSVITVVLCLVATLLVFTSYLQPQLITDIGQEGSHVFVNRSSLADLFMRVDDFPPLFQSESCERQYNVVTVACGESYQQRARVLLTSLSVTNSCVTLHVFADGRLPREPRGEVGGVSVHFHRITYPPGLRREWLPLFGQCATQRLFLPAVAPELGTILYVDSDTLFLRPADRLFHLWQQSATPAQVAAAAPESLDPDDRWAWYPNHARHPYPGVCGLNSGVLLMDLAKMAALNFTAEVVALRKKWSSLPYPDQDLINIYFAGRPDRLLWLPCQWNYRFDFCHASPATCRGPVAALHGNRGSFTENTQMRPFKQVYDVMRLAAPPDIWRHLTDLLAARRPSGHHDTCHEELIKSFKANLTQNISQKTSFNSSL